MCMTVQWKLKILLREIQDRSRKDTTFLNTEVVYYFKPNDGSDSEEMKAKSSYEFLLHTSFT